METLSKLFSGEARVKIMRLFLFNPQLIFSVAQVVEKAKVPARVVKAEIEVLQKSGMIRGQKSVQLVKSKKRGKIVEVKKKILGWHLDQNFEYLLPLQNLLINTRPLRSNEIVKKFSNAGKIKLLIVSGVFIQNPDSRVDVLVVGDNLKKGYLDRTVKNIEAEIGKELVFASFETADFQYRLGMYDKLIRDILDYPHQKLLDKLNIGLGGK